MYATWESATLAGSPDSAGRRRRNAR